MKLKYSLFTVLFIGCSPLTMNSYEINERLEGLKKVNNLKPLSDKDYEYDFIGQKVEFVKINREMIEWYDKGTTPWFSSTGKTFSYGELVGKKGILDWIRIEQSLYSDHPTPRWYKITLEDKRVVFCKRSTSDEVSTTITNTNGFIPKVYVLSEFERTKNNYLNKSIWLNKPKFYSSLFPTLVENNQPQFGKLEEVIVKEVIPFGGTGYPPFYYFLIESKDKTKTGYIQVSQPRNKVDNYYDKYPFESDWDEEIVETIKLNKIKLGMTKEQVTLSWGNPDDINRTVTKNSSREQWVYSRGSYENYYLYFENGILDSFQD